MERSAKRLKRKLRVRAKLTGTKERPRLSVFRSSRFIYAQLIDDISKRTIVGISEKHLDKEDLKLKKTERAKKTGNLLAKKAIAKKITKVIFDRGGYAYQGRVKSLAQGAREGGLEF